eukprot:scaffold17740_cov74-Skeletonema_dohrnii-CCMP3373.AAC.1
MERCLLELNSKQRVSHASDYIEPVLQNTSWRETAEQDVSGSTIHHIMAHRTRQEMKESSTSIQLPFREVKTSSLSQIFFFKRMAV